MGTQCLDNIQQPLCAPKISAALDRKQLHASPNINGTKDAYRGSQRQRGASNQHGNVGGGSEACRTGVLPGIELRDISSCKQEWQIGRGADHDQSKSCVGSPPTKARQIDMTNIENERRRGDHNVRPDQKATKG